MLRSESEDWYLAATARAQAHGAWVALFVQPDRRGGQRPATRRVDGESPKMEVATPTNGRWAVSCADRPPAGTITLDWASEDAVSLDSIKSRRRAAASPTRSRCRVVGVRQRVGSPDAARRGQGRREPRASVAFVFLSLPAASEAGGSRQREDTTLCGDSQTFGSILAEQRARRRRRASGPTSWRRTILPTYT